MSLVRAAAPGGRRCSWERVQQGGREGSGYALETDTSGSSQGRLDDSMCIVGRAGEGRGDSRMTPRFLEDGGGMTEVGRQESSRLDRVCVVGARAQCGTL